MPPVWQGKRLSRSPAGRPGSAGGVARGSITAGRAEAWIRLPRDRQRLELTAWLGKREAKAQIYRLAAEAINACLEGLEGKPVLPEVAECIQAVLTQR
jgi:hypothetical protein